MDENVTLQINTSPGDVAYAHITIPALVKQHQTLNNRLLIVDCCRPGRSKLIDPDKKFPWPIFSKKVAAIKEIAEDLLNKKIVTQVVYLEPNAPLFNLLSKKYLNGWYKNTHSSGGTANMSYWAAVELPQTKYVLHYDCDILLYQKPGYSWVNDAMERFKEDPNIIMAVPRLCPPVKGLDAPSLNEGRPFSSHYAYWKNDWFSTRHFLMDKERFSSYLPLVKGKVLFELLLRKYGKRAFPLDPEIIMFKSMAPKGAKRITLKNENAWILHPLNKPPEFIEALNDIVPFVTDGKFPLAQAGKENIELASWLEYLANKH